MVLQKRLDGTATSIVTFVALPQEVVAIAIDARGIRATRTPIARERLDRLVATGDLTALYGILIAPMALAEARQLIVVPDAHLESVPFAALFDVRTRKYLVERMPVAMAVSAMSLLREPAPVPRSVLAMALPSGAATHSAALAEQASELLDVQQSYAESATLSGDAATFAAFLGAAGRADVVHLAGHTGREAGAGDAALLFRDERVAWKRIAIQGTTVLRGAIVVLAACETLRAPHGPQSNALSLGGGFLAAGASSVIGTLTPIADREARDVFGAIHRALAAGNGPAEAVRSAQLTSIARNEEAWKSIATLTRRIPTERKREVSHGRPGHDPVSGSVHPSHAGNHGSPAPRRPHQRRGQRNHQEPQDHFASAGAPSGLHALPIAQRQTAADRQRHRRRALLRSDV
jgi:CHAT domain-containing protein